MRKILKWLGLLAATVVVIMALLLSIARAITPYLANYQPELQQWAVKALGLPVQIGQVKAAWYNLEPVLSFSDVIVLNKKHTRHLLKIKQLQIGVNIFSSLLHRRLDPGRITVVGANLGVRQNKKGEIHIRGMRALTKTKVADSDADITQGLIEWLARQHEINLRDINLKIHLADGQRFNFQNLNFRLSNNLLGYHLIGTGTLEQRLPIFFRFVVDLTGDPVERKDIKANIYISIANFPLSQWLQNQSFHGYSLADGTAKFRIWANWDKNHIADIQTEIAANQLAVNIDKTKKVLKIPNFSGNFYWLNEGKDRWEFSADQLKLGFGDRIWPQTAFSIQVQPGEKAIKASYLNLADIEMLIKNAEGVPKTWLDYLQEFKPVGQLYNLTVSEKQAPNKTQQYAISTGFNNLSIKASRKLPGLSNASGTISFSQGRAKIHLLGAGMQVIYPKLFAKPVTIDALDADLSWQHDATGMTLSAPVLKLSTPALGVNGSLQLSIPSDGSSPVIDLLLGVRIARVSQLKFLVPKDIIKKDLNEWLTDAFPSGKSVSGTLLLRGPLKAFPFKQQQGRFIVDADFKQMNFVYAPHWPIMTNVSGNLVFDDNSLQINADSGTLANSQITKASAHMADMETGIMTVRGEVNSKLADAQQYVMDSPLRNRIGKQLDGLELRKPMHLSLQMTLPLHVLHHKDPKGLKINGLITMPGNDITIKQANLSINNIKGQLAFTQDGISAKNLTGSLLNQPLTFSIATSHPKGQEAITNVDLAGKMTLEGLGKQFGTSPLYDYVSGGFNYNAILSMQRNAQGVSHVLTLQSNLQGISVNLPAPFHKTSNQAMPYQFKLTQSSDQSANVALRYGKLLSANVTLKPNKQKQLRFTRGELLLGSGIATAQRYPGLLIGGSLATFDWAQWEPIYERLNATHGSQQTGIKLRSANVYFNQIKAAGFTLSKTRLTAIPGKSTWQLGINGPVATGTVTIPTNDFLAHRIDGKFSHLYLPSSNNKTARTINPTQIPSLSLDINNFRYGKYHLSRLSLNTTRTNNGMRINKLNLGSKDTSINARGSWTGQIGHEKTVLIGSLYTRDLGGALSRMNISSALGSGKGSAAFSLRWQGAPNAVKAGLLNGNVALELKDGRIIDVGKADLEVGIGRIVSLFSLSSLPRRLHLNFSDVTDKGFSYDIFKGDLQIKNGNATTNNIYLEGPSATVRLSGRIGLAKEDYDLLLKITPEVTGTLPIIATIAGGPIAGAITWVVTKIVSKEVQKITTYNYRVTGTWAKPKLLKLQLPKPRR